MVQNGTSNSCIDPIPSSHTLRAMTKSRFGLKPVACKICEWVSTHTSTHENTYITDQKGMPISDQSQVQWQNAWNTCLSWNMCIQWRTSISELAKVCTKKHWSSLHPCLNWFRGPDFKNKKCLRWGANLMLLFQTPQIIWSTLHIVPKALHVRPSSVSLFSFQLYFLSTEFASQRSPLSTTVRIDQKETPRDDRFRSCFCLKLYILPHIDVY